MTELQKKIQETFGTKENHENTLRFMLNSELGTWIQLQTNENINKLAILLEEYHQSKSE